MPAIDTPSFSKIQINNGEVEIDYDPYGNTITLSINHRLSQVVIRSPEDAALLGGYLLNTAKRLESGGV